MVSEVLDYSVKVTRENVVAFRNAGYIGAVRYMGTPGRNKNLTRDEARWYNDQGLFLAPVYEDSAGWMLGGFAAGIAAAKAVLLDATDCAIGLRAAYFACDVDITDQAQMVAVERCLDGAAEVLGRARVGVYGEYDVIEACLGGEHATWGWQTKAWSGGKLSKKAHLLQRLGYVYPGGVQCDKNTVLQEDWGGWKANMEEDVPNTPKELQDAAYAALNQWATERHDAQPAATLREFLQLFKPEVVTNIREMATEDVPARLAAIEEALRNVAVGGTPVNVDLDALADKVVQRLGALRFDAQTGTP